MPPVLLFNLISDNIPQIGLMYDKTTKSLTFDHPSSFKYVSVMLLRVNCAMLKLGTHDVTFSCDDLEKMARSCCIWDCEKLRGYIPQFSKIFPP